MFPHKKKSYTAFIYMKGTWYINWLISARVDTYKLETTKVFQSTIIVIKKKKKKEKKEPLVSQKCYQQWELILRFLPG